jgi:hypothetical protein
MVAVSRLQSLIACQCQQNWDKVGIENSPVKALGFSLDVAFESR